VIFSVAQHGRRGSAAHAGFDTAYLPLDTARSQLPVIDVLRDGRHTGRHWVVVDLDPTGGRLIGPDAVRLADHRDEIASPDAIWQPATVTATAVAGGVYPALVADGYTVRGDDVLARFDRRTAAEEMVADLTAVHADTNRDSDPMPGEYCGPLLAVHRPSSPEFRQKSFKTCDELRRSCQRPAFDDRPCCRQP